MPHTHPVQATTVVANSPLTLEEILSVGITRYRSTVRERSNRPGRWELDCRPWGPKIYGYRGNGFTSKEAAKIIQSFIEADLAKGLDPEDALLNYVTEENKANQIKDTIPRWLERKRREAESSRIGEDRVGVLEAYARLYIIPWWSGKSTREINYANVEDFADWLLKQGHRRDGTKGMSPNTANHVLQAFSNFCHWLHRRREILQTPTIAYHKTQAHDPVILGENEQSAVLDAIPEERRGVFLCLAHGLRHSEARVLECSDFSVRLVDGKEVGFLSVTKGADGESSTASVGCTKNQKNRDVPVSDELRTWIENSLKNRIGGLLFRNPTGRAPGNPWLPSALKREWDRATKNAGVRRAPSYEGCKHSTASRWLANGQSRATIQALLGVTKSTLAHYAKVTELSKVRAVKGE